MKIIFSGILSILLGLFCFLPFIISDMTNSVIHESEYLIGKYFISIVLVSGALYFIILGVFILTGKMAPYILSKEKIEKVKHNLFGSLFALPVLLSATLIIYELSSIVIWKFVWLFILLFYLISFVYNIRFFLNRRNRV